MNEPMNEERLECGSAEFSCTHPLNQSERERDKERGESKGERGRERKREREKEREREM
jgi:hypothetical protein